jgi:LuxR family maltose regulon positive regulatory protein
VLEAIARGVRRPGRRWARPERALDLAEPDGALLWFVLHPVPDLLERHARQRTAHAALVADVLSLPAGQDLGRPPGRGRRWRR